MNFCKTSAKGLFIGLCGIDIVYYDTQPLPNPNEKSKINDFIMNVGGPATNAAITFAALGGDATLISAIGNSATGIFIKNILHDYGVTVFDLCENRNQPCNISSIHVNLNNGERTILSGQQIMKIKSFSIDDTLVADCDFILYDGNLYGIVEENPLGIENEIVRIMGDKGLELVIDAGSHKEGFVTCFTPQTTVISSENYKNADGEDIFVQETRHPLLHCAKTRGGKSILYEEYGEIKELDVEVRHAVDTLAAGDIFHGAYCFFKYADKLEFVDALKHAARFAGLFVEKKGVREGILHARSIMKL